MRREIRQALWLFGAVAFVLLLLSLAIPNLDGPGSRAVANEAAAVGQLRRLNNLELAYASKAPRPKFACSFADLEAVAQPDLKPLFPEGNRRAGYSFSLRCPSEKADN